MRGRIVYGRKIRYFLDDKEVSRAKYDEAFPSKFEELLEGGSFLPAHTTTCWPMVSEALAVAPHQIPAAMEKAKRHGIPTNFDHHGRPFFTSRGHRKEYIRMEGAHDNNGGYGD